MMFWYHSNLIIDTEYLEFHLNLRLLTAAAVFFQFDMIYWTGDLPPHDIWNQTRESQLEVLQKLTNKLLAYFPNTPIYPAVGNHESAPVDR